AGAARGGRRDVPGRGRLRRSGGRARLAGATGGILSAGRDPLHSPGLDWLVRQHVVTIVGVLGVRGGLPPVHREDRAAAPLERTAIQPRGPRPLGRRVGIDTEAEQADWTVAVMTRPPTSSGPP